MKKRLILALTFALCGCITPGAFANQTQTVQDDAGRTVTVPINPTSIISSHDAIITITLIELGLPVTGSYMRKEKTTNNVTIFGLKELFGKEVSDYGIHHVSGGKEMDFEAIRALNPDLYLGHEGAQKHEKNFEGIAPIYIVKSRKSKGNETEYLIAKRFNKLDKYNELNATYQQRLSEVRAKLPFDPSTKTYVDVSISDKISAVNYIGGINKVMNNLGFKTPGWLKDTTGRVDVSPEELKKIDVDLVFMSSMYFKENRNNADTDMAMSKVAPGWEKFMKAKKENRIIYYDSYKTLTPTFASAMNTLDYLEKYYAQ